MRVLHTQPQAFEAFVADCNRLLNETASHTRDPQIHSTIECVKKAVDFLENFGQTLSQRTVENQKWLAVIRTFAFSLTRTYIACLLLNTTIKSCRDTNDTKLHHIVAVRWCARPLILIEDVSKTLNKTGIDQAAEEDKLLALDSAHYPSFQNRPRAKM